MIVDEPKQEANNTVAISLIESTKVDCSRRWTAYIHSTYDEPFQPYTSASSEKCLFVSAHQYQSDFFLATEIVVKYFSSSEFIDIFI